MFQDMASFEVVKKERFIIDHILWDVEPKDIMEPRYSIGQSGVTVRDVIKGYIFYIDMTTGDPQLFLLRHTAGDYAETVCRVEHAPVELLEQAVAENMSKEFFKMYPINAQVKDWLKNELSDGDA
jgi:hypothetical protein